jgi:hypothetical protein
MEELQYMVSNTHIHTHQRSNQHDSGINDQKEVKEKQEADTNANKGISHTQPKLRKKTSFRNNWSLFNPSFL